MKKQVTEAEKEDVVIQNNPHPEIEFNHDFIKYSTSFRIRLAQFVAQETDFILENSSTYKEALENMKILFSQSNEFSDMKNAIRVTLMTIALNGKID